MKDERSFRVLIICIGNSLVADDAVAHIVYDQLRGVRTDTAGTYDARPSCSAISDDVRALLLGIGGISLLEHIRGEETLIVVDAVQFGAPPGTVHVLPWDRVPRARGLPVSLHGIGLREAMDIGQILYPELMPKNVFLVGIEGVCFDQIGGEMTPEVASAVAPALAEIVKLANLSGVF